MPFPCITYLLSVVLASALSPVTIPRMTSLNTAQYPQLLAMSSRNTELLREMYSLVFEVYSISRMALPDWKPEIIRQYNTQGVLRLRAQVNPWMDGMGKSTELLGFMQTQFNDLYRFGGLLESFVSIGNFKKTLDHLTSSYPDSYIEKAFLAPLRHLDFYRNVLEHWLNNCVRELAKIKLTRPKAVRVFARSESIVDRVRSTVSNNRFNHSQELI